MRIERRHRFLLAGALAVVLCAGTASAHVRHSREPRPLREPQQTLVAPWDDLEKLLDDLRKVEPSPDPLLPPPDHAGPSGDVLLLLLVDSEASAPSAPASSPACEPPPPRLER